MENKYYSQFGEDKFLDGLGILPTKGFFVDVGAFDGIEFSNTYFLEQRGWQGICIDPNPLVAKELALNRKNVYFCGVAKKPGFYNLNLFPKVPMQCNINEKNKKMPTVKVWCNPLQDIVAPLTDKIDLLSLDAEGMDIEAWESLKHPQFDPKIVIVEHITIYVANNWFKLSDIFSKLPYKLILETQLNLVFQHI